MPEPIRKSSGAGQNASPSGGSPRLGPQVSMMVRALLASPQRNRILLLGIALVAIIGATAFAQIKLNAWNQPFFDALSRKSLREFLAH